MKKTILILVSIVFLLGFNFALADVVINEVQIKPTGESFIELYNSNASQDLTGWSVKRKTASGLEYSLVSESRLKDKSISSNGYFLLTNEDYTGSISPDAMWAKSYSIANDNTVILYDTNGSLIDKASWGNTNDCSNNCPSNPEEGKSIQRNENGSFVVATPTPGEANQTSSSSLDSDSDSSISDETPAKTKIVETPKIKTEILAKNISFVGIPAIFKANATGYSGELLSYGRYFWNFGDGDSREIKISDFNNLQNINHTYFYPGEYNVSLEYYTNYYGNTPDAFDKMVVKVVGADIIISTVGDVKDFFVELSNNTNYDVDISSWILASDIQRFVFPKNTILGSKKKTVFSSKVTNLSIFDKDSLKLLNSQGEILFDYGSLVAKVITVKNSVKPKISPTISLLSEKTALAREEVPISNDANLDLSIDNLPASALLSDVVKDNPLRIYIFSLVLTIFVGGSAGAVYLVRRKKVVSNIGDDFKIIDE